MSVGNSSYIETTQELKVVTLHISTPGMIQVLQSSEKLIFLSLSR